MANLIIQNYKQLDLTHITGNPPITQSGSNYIQKCTLANNVYLVTYSTDINWYFVGIPTLTISDGVGGTEKFTALMNDTQDVASFSLPKSALSEYYGSQGRLNDMQTAERPPTTLEQFITFYKMNDAKLSEFSKEAIVRNDSSGGFVDLTQFVTSLRRYPFDFATSSEIGIKLGPYELATKAGVIEEQYHEIDMGNIDIPSTNQNLNDFDNTKVSLLLPFMGLKDVTSNRYIGQSINLKYDVDIMTGKCIATLSIGDFIADLFTGEIGLDIPYSQRGGTSIMAGNIDTTINTLYPLEASAYIEYHDNAFADNTVRVNITAQKSISEARIDYDYVEMSDITNFPNPLNGTEIGSMILQALEEGIYLNS